MLVVSGSARLDGQAAAVMEHVLEVTRAAGAEPRIVFDVCRYAPVVGAAFEAARRLGAGVESGVAGLHHEDS